MDFVPEASSAAYQCYVSESDTDGEGDGSKRRSSTNTNPQRRPWSKFQGIGAFSLASTKVNGDEYHECSASKSAAEAVQHQEQQHGSILAKFSSWSISSRWEKASPAGAGQRREGPHGGSALRKCAQKGEAGKLSGSENARGRHSTTTHALRCVSTDHRVKIALLSRPCTKLKSAQGSRQSCTYLRDDSIFVTTHLLFFFHSCVIGRAFEGMLSKLSPGISCAKKLEYVS